MRANSTNRTRPLRIELCHFGCPAFAFRIDLSLILVSSACRQPLRVFSLVLQWLARNFQGSPPHPRPVGWPIHPRVAGNRPKIYDLRGRSHPRRRPLRGQPRQGQPLRGKPCQIPRCRPPLRGQHLRGQPLLEARLEAQPLRGQLLRGQLLFEANLLEASIFDNPFRPALPHSSRMASLRTATSRPTSSRPASFRGQPIRGQLLGLKHEKTMKTLTF